jgi:hypothetical protein
MQSNLKVFMANISVESVEKPQNSWFWGLKIKPGTF